MRFAFKTANHQTSWPDVLRLWREADQIDLFESGWVFDHLYPIRSPGGPSPIDGPCLEGWTMLAALAQATSRLRLGCMVTGTHFRHPSLLAKMAVTVDHISNGRLELGLGAGWNADESKAFGIELLPLRQRFDRFDEYLEVLVRLFRDEVANFDGRYFKLDDAHLVPKTLQRPHPPILIGGNGEQRTLPTVARYADHWNFVAGSADVYRQKRAALNACCEAIGRDPSSLTVSAHVWLNANRDFDSMRRELEGLQKVGLDLAIIYLTPPLSPSPLERLAEVLSEFR